LKKKLGLIKYARWIPYPLTENIKKERVNIAMQNLAKVAAERKFLVLV
jgi:hypothetical protein